MEKKVFGKKSMKKKTPEKIRNRLKSFEKSLWKKRILVYIKDFRISY